MSSGRLNTENTCLYALKTTAKFGYRAKPEQQIERQGDSKVK